MTKEETTHNLPDLSPATPLKKAVWRLRRLLRDTSGADRLKDSHLYQPLTYRIYKKADQFIAQYFPKFTSQISKKDALIRVKDMIKEEGYIVVDTDEQKPWGAYYRISNNQAERFIESFFPGLTLQEARLGRDDIEISPKFLLVSPEQRLSWQYHNRRAERWRFLTKGAYIKSTTDQQTDPVEVEPDTIVQFAKGDRHRLIGQAGDYTLVAEIWQHTDPREPSNEADIIRLQDDYDR